MSTRNTVQKQLIRQSLDKLQHPTAEDIWLDVSLALPDVSRTTVYRNLKQMVKDHRLRALQVDGGATRYDIVGHDHAHFICRTCGKIYDLPLMDVDLEAFQADFPDFQVKKVDVLLSGECPDCKANS